MNRCALLLYLGLVLLASGPVVPQSSVTDAQALRNLLGNGRRLAEDGDYAGAIGSYRRALQLDPRSVEAHAALGWCYVRTSQLRNAVSSFNSALTLAPGDLSARRGLGLAYFRLGRHQECVLALKSAIGALAADPQTQFAYGKSLLELKDPGAALPYLRAADARSRPDPAVLLSLAQAYQDLGRLQEAELHYDRVLQMEPKHSRALYGLLDLYEQAQRHLDRRQLLRQMLADTPNDPVLLGELARENQALGLGREALRTYEKLSSLVRGTQALTLHLNLARAYMNGGQPTLARPHYQAAIAQEPQDAGLRAELADCLLALGRRDEAAEQYRQAAVLAPTEPAWLFRLARLLAELGRGEEALQAYQAGLELDPTNESALAAVADLARDLDRPDLARDALISLAAARPNVISVRLALSDVYRELGDSRAADVQAWEILRQDPRNVEARYRLAQSAEELGDFDAAIAHLKAIQTLDTSRVEYLAPLGRLLAAQGRLDEAIVEYAALLQRDPKNLALRSDLAALYLRTRRLGKAKDALLGILAEKPQSTWALDRLARCEELGGDLEQALRIRRAVARAAPDDTEYLEALVRLYERAGRPQQGTDFLVTLLATSNPPPQVVHTLVAAYRRHEGDEVALEQVRGLAAIFKYRPVFQRVAAELCAGMGFRAEAIQRYARYMRLEPSDWEALQVLVALCRDAGELSACHAYLQRYVEANPDHLAGLRELARAALDNDRPADAHAAALRVVDLSPADPAGYRLLADALAALSGPPKAVIALRARAQQSSDPAPQVGLAYAYVLNGEPGQALALLSAAAETRRTEAEAAYVRGVAKDALGLHDEAVIELARAASSLTAPADYRAMLAATLATAGRPEDALWEYSFLLNSPASEARGISGVRQLLAARAVEPEAACEALRRVGVDRGPSRALVGLLSDVLCKAAPSDTIVALNDICDVWRNSEMAADALARAYQELNQPDQEARALTRLVDMRPANVGYQLRLARAHERAEAPSRAADAYGMVLAFDPRNREAQDALDRLLAQERTPPPAPPPVQPVARPPIPRLADPPSSRAILAPT